MTRIIAISLFALLVFTATGNAQLSPVYHLQDEKYSGIYLVRFTADSQKVYFQAQSDPRFHLLDLGSQTISIFWQPDSFSAMDAVISDDQKLVALVGIHPENNGIVYERETNRILFEAPKQERAFHYVIFFPKSPYIACSRYRDGEIFIYNYQTGELLSQFFGGVSHFSNVSWEVFPDERRMLIGGNVFDIESQKVLFETGFGSRLINNGKHIVSTTGEQRLDQNYWQVIVQDAETGEIVRESPEFPYIPNGTLRFSPDGRFFAAFAMPNEAGVLETGLTIRNAETANALATLRAQTGGEQAAAEAVFSPDGKKLAITDRNSLIIYNVSDVTSRSQGAVLDEE